MLFSYAKNWFKDKEIRVSAKLCTNTGLESVMFKSIV